MLNIRYNMIHPELLLQIPSINLIHWLIKLFVDPINE